MRIEDRQRTATIVLCIRALHPTLGGNHVRSACDIELQWRLSIVPTSWAAAQEKRAVFASPWTAATWISKKVSSIISGLMNDSESADE